MSASNFDPATGILTLRPTAPLAAENFQKIAETVDPWIANNGKLKALIIEAAEFPGWDSFNAMLSHFHFVRDHHKQIRKVAVVTNSPMGSIAEKFASHFVAAEIKHFPGGEMGEARRWALA